MRLGPTGNEGVSTSIGEGVVSAVAAAACDFAVARKQRVAEQRFPERRVRRVELCVAWERFDGLISAWLEAFVRGSVLRFVAQVAAERRQSSGEGASERTSDRSTDSRSHRAHAPTRFRPQININVQQ